MGQCLTEKRSYKSGIRRGDLLLWCTVLDGEEIICWCAIQDTRIRVCFSLTERSLIARRLVNIWGSRCGACLSLIHVKACGEIFSQSSLWYRKFAREYYYWNFSMALCPVVALYMDRKGQVLSGQICSTIYLQQIERIMFIHTSNYMRTPGTWLQKD